MPDFDFADAFQRLTDNAPFPWQSALYERFLRGDFPASCNLPTGLGKTAVIHIWLLALAHAPTLVPRRLVYVVNRRTVVDQSTDEARKLRERLPDLPGVLASLRDLCATRTDIPLAISTLRGQFADNREWSSDPARPAIIAGTVDMVGSRLLFSGYGCGFKSRPLHAGFLGQDALLVHDEAHLEPAFQELLIAIQREQHEGRAPDFRPLHVIELTATSRAGIPASFGLGDEDYRNDTVRQRIFAKKGIVFHEPHTATPPTRDGAKDVRKKAKKTAVAEKIADLAAEYRDSRQAILIFVRTLDEVEIVVKKLKAMGAEFEVLTGELLRDRTDRVLKHLQDLAKEHANAPCWLIAGDGSVNWMMLGALAALTKEELNWKTVILPPAVGGLTRAGMFGDGEPADNLDVADEWRDDAGGRRRIRVWDDEPIPEDLGRVRLVRTVDTKPEREDEQTEENPNPRRLWKWYVRPLSAEQDSGPAAPLEQPLEQHHADAEKAAAMLAAKLLTDQGLRNAIRLAARWHDLGKNRALWQVNMGNRDYPQKVIAKTGHSKPPKEWIHYRHEFGTLLDLLDQSQPFFAVFQSEPEEIRDLILHLIAAHHGRGRPHFSPDEFTDSVHREALALQAAAEVPRRFARLQRRYGRWGLAWLESLVRAADAEATVNPTRGAQ